MEFLSTPSARRATSPRTGHYAGMPYFYPRPPRGGRLRKSLEVIQMKRISIHALREEGDMTGIPTTWTLCISIHALREEGDHLRHQELQT